MKRRGHEIFRFVPRIAPLKFPLLTLGGSHPSEVLI